MKKNLLFIAVLISIVAISSCKKTSSSSSTSAADLIGTWEATSLKTTIVVSGSPAVSYDSTYTHGHSIVEIFNADSTGGFIDDTQTPPDSTMGTYYVSNDSIYTRQTGTSVYQPGGKFSISGNILTVTNTTIQSGYTETGTMNLIRQ